jgi:phage terminase small subunit
MAGQLTPRKAIFITEYSLHGNGTRAATVAGVPEASAHVTASRWLKEPKVVAAIDEQRARLTAKLELTSERVLLELMRMAYYDPAKLYDENGQRIPVHLLDEDTRRAVASVEDETREAKDASIRTQYVKMADKKGAAELLGRYLKMFTDNVDHHHKVTLEQLVCGNATGDAARS